jgi:hypothetical protein
MLAVMAGLETGSLVDTTELIAVLAGVVMLVESVVNEALALGEDAPMPFKMKLPILSVDEDGGNGEGVVDAARVMEVKEFDDSVRMSIFVSRFATWGVLLPLAACASITHPKHKRTFMFARSRICRSDRDHRSQKLS